MISVALLNPEIPPNTGNIGRLCLAIGATLHLIKPLGFELDDKRVKRAGLDYWKRVDLRVWDNFDSFANANDHSCFVLTSSKRGDVYYEVQYKADDIIIFGPETRGLDSRMFQEYGHRVARIPVLERSVRSLNLSTAAGVIVYEALKQSGQIPK